MQKIILNFLLISMCSTFPWSAFSAGIVDRGLHQCGWVNFGAKPKTRNISNNVILDGLVSAFSSTTPGTTSATSTSSSATSNTSCGGSGSASIQKYIYKSYVFLEEDISKGKGPHLEALATLFDCHQNTHSQLFYSLQQSIFTSSEIPGNQNDKAKHLYETLQTQAAAICWGTPS